MPREATVFLSYQSESRTKIEAVRNSLEMRGIRSWMDKREIAPGDDWLLSIGRGLRNSRLLILFLTRDCETSQYVIQELLTAESLGLPILVVRFEDYEPTTSPLNRVSRFQFLDAFDAPIENYLDAIWNAVRHKLADNTLAISRVAGRDLQALPNSPVADLGDLVYDAWIRGFLLPTLSGTSIKEGHTEGIDRPYTFYDTGGTARFKSSENKPLSSVLKRATGRLLICGGRGSGKTILMLQLVRDLIPLSENIDDTMVPLYLNAGSWVDPRKLPNQQPKILDWVKFRLVKEYQIHSKRAESLIDSKSIVYCIDGLDEIIDSDYGDTAQSTGIQSTEIQIQLIHTFMSGMRDLLGDNSQQVALTCGPTVQSIISGFNLGFCRLDIEPWTHDDLMEYLKNRGLNALGAFIEVHPEIENRLIHSFSELQMLATIYLEVDVAAGLEERAEYGIDKFFTSIYDIYLKIKYDRFANEARRRKDNCSLKISLSSLVKYSPAIAEYISQPGQGEAFRLDTLQPYDLPKRLDNYYRWITGALIGLGIGITAGGPVLACIVVEHLVWHAPLHLLLLHVIVAILGYIMAGTIAAIGFRVTRGWTFGLVVGLAFAIGKGFASGCSWVSRGFTRGWDAGIHNGLAALIAGLPVFAAIFFQIREEPYKIAPIETWDSDKGKLPYWILGSLALGVLFAQLLGWAKGLSFASALGIFAYMRFGKKPRLAPVHLRPNQAILYSSSNAITNAGWFSLTVAIATGFSYGTAYGWREGSLDAVMALSAFVTVFFFGGLPVVKHKGILLTLWRDDLTAKHLEQWLETASRVGLMKLVGSGYVFSSDDARREYASRWKRKDPQGSGWGESDVRLDTQT